MTALAAAATPEHPALTNARHVLELEEQERRRRRIDPHLTYLRRVWVCIALAPSLDICKALLRGEPVHPDTLDQDQLAHLQGRGLWTDA